MELTSMLCAQVYGGMVFMDFERRHMEEHGHGR